MKEFSSYDVGSGRIISFNVLFHNVEMKIFSLYFLMDTWIDITQSLKGMKHRYRERSDCLQSEQICIFCGTLSICRKLPKYLLTTSCGTLADENQFVGWTCFGVGFSNMYFNSINNKNLMCKIKELLKRWILCKRCISY